MLVRAQPIQINFCHLVHVDLNHLEWLDGLNGLFLYYILQQPIFIHFSLKMYLEHRT